MPTTSQPHGAAATKKPGFIVPIGFTIAIFFMGGDIIPLSLRPLNYLGIPYPHILKYTHFIAPVAGLNLWIMFRRSMFAAIIGFLAAVMAIESVAHWADAEPIKIPVTRMIDPNEWEAWQKQLGFKVWEQADSQGASMWVDRRPGRAEKVRAEVKRMAIEKP